MLRSEVFTDASTEWKNLALWLMLMALFCDRQKTTPARIASFIELCSELGFPVEKLSIESLCELQKIEKNLTFNHLPLGPS
jgi:hypothetical protein